MRAATVVQQVCKSCRTCFKFYCMFHFTCDRSFSPAYKAGSLRTPRLRGTKPTYRPLLRKCETHITSVYHRGKQRGVQRGAGPARCFPGPARFMYYSRRPRSRRRESRAAVVGPTDHRAARLGPVTDATLAQMQKQRPTGRGSAPGGREDWRKPTDTQLACLVDRRAAATSVACRLEFNTSGNGRARAWLPPPPPPPRSRQRGWRCGDRSGRPIDLLRPSGGIMIRRVCWFVLGSLVTHSVISREVRVHFS